MKSIPPTHRAAASKEAAPRVLVGALGLFVAISGFACPHVEDTPPLAPTVARTPPAVPDAEPPAAIVDDAGADAGNIVWDPAPIDRVVADALVEKKMPGCVVVIGRHDRILHRKAYGMRSLEPTREPMDVETMFDIASLTKPVATASSVMVLVDRKVLALDEPVAKTIPIFAGKGKENVTLRNLLLHTGGLPAVSNRGDWSRGIGEAMLKVGAMTPRAAPGNSFKYSDVGFIVLGEVVARASGKSLDAFAKENVFEPLGMKDTTFLPAPALKARIAPTELRRSDNVMLRGEVHDPTSNVLGGVAGNAGVFSTGDDLAKFAQTMLGRGSANGNRLFSEQAWHDMISVHDVPGGLRALGWDVKSALSTNRSDRFSRRAFGHGGYTGTSLWLDPARDLFIVFLSNRVHPDGKGAVNPVVQKINGLAASAIDAAEGKLAAPSDCEATKVLPGIDVIAAEDFRRLAGKRVALLSNAGARAASGRSTFDVLKEALGPRLTLVYTPEHGFGADKEGKIADGTLEGVPFKSLYGATYAPDDATLASFDVLVADLPDVGARHFTYAATLHRVMRALAPKGKPIIILDRPNPYGGSLVDGPTEIPAGSFVQHHPIPLLHGMTIAELAYLMDADEHLGTEIDVVPVRGWKRSMTFEETGLTWTAPSPNLPTFGAAVAYAASALVEGTNVSVGRGTSEPFAVIGAPWLNPQAMIKSLNGMGLIGVTFEPGKITPTVGPYSNTEIPVVRFKVTDRASYKPVRVGLAFAIALHANHPTDWKDTKLDGMVGAKLGQAVREGQTLSSLEAIYKADLNAFVAKRAKHLLYGDCDAIAPL